jgi:ABC-type maltose transport system permease subunit
VLLFIPLFELIFRLDLLNTRGGLIVAYLTFTVPFTTWLLMGYFRTVPVALEEAALVDPVVLYLLGQRWVVRGLTAGAVKG